MNNKLKQNQNNIIEDIQKYREREELVRQYTSLVYKIVNQEKHKTALSYDDLVGYAWLGLADALNNYKEGKGQTFVQYAAYRIYYFIKNGGYSSGHIVKFTAYQQNKAREKGLPTYIYKSIITKTNDDGDIELNIPDLAVDPDQLSPDQIYENLVDFIRQNYNERDTDIFIRYFGLCGVKRETGVKIAKKYNITSANVTYIIQKIIKKIKTNNELMDNLSTIFN